VFTRRRAGEAALAAVRVVDQEAVQRAEDRPVARAWAAAAEWAEPMLAAPTGRE